MPFINVHYTWIGPPRFDQRDVGAPKAMMRAKNGHGGKPFVIHFWCLDAHVTAFRDHFRASNFRVGNGEKLTVRSIERYLERNTGVHRSRRSALLNSAINWVWSSFSWNIDLTVHTIVATSTRSNASGPTRIREIVNAKNVWSLYVLYKEGGYAMDTGVGPGQNGTVSIREWDTFKAPAQAGNGGIGDAIVLGHKTGAHSYLSGRCTAATTGVAGHLGIDGSDTAPHVDVWTMYSPAGSGEITRALEWYIRFWFIAEEVRKSTRYDSDYYKDLCRHGIISSIFTGMSHDGNGFCRGIDDQFLWTADLGEDAGIPAIGIKKSYYGSHH